MAEELDPRPWRAGSRPMDFEEKEMVLRMYSDERLTIAEIARRTGRKHGTISKFLHSMSPTAYLAQSFLKANAMTLAKRVVEKADVNQAIDILSRPNIGVLKPMQKGADAPQIHISVNTDSIGAVVMPTNMGLPPAPLPVAESSIKLVGNGASDGAQNEPDRTAHTGGESSNQGGHAVSAQEGAGLRGAPLGTVSFVGPTGLAGTRGDVGTGRQRGVARQAARQAPVEVLEQRQAAAKKDRSRPAIINRSRPNSSINLSYTIESNEDE